MHAKFRSFQTWQIVAAPLSCSKCNIILDLYMLPLVSASVNLQSALQLLKFAINHPTSDMENWATTCPFL